MIRFHSLTDLVKTMYSHKKKEDLFQMEMV